MQSALLTAPAATTADTAPPVLPRDELRRALAAAVEALRACKRRGDWQAKKGLALRARRVQELLGTSVAATFLLLDALAE